jgi:predicted dehydrogenase
VVDASRRRGQDYERTRVGHVRSIASMVRSVIVGTGFIGAVHARAVRRAGGVTVGVVGRTPEGAARAADAWDVGASSSSLAVLLERVEADLVHVCTPNGLHAEQVGAALAADVNVICEKPLGMSAAQADAMWQAAAARQVVHAMPFVYRFYPAVRELRARLRAGGRVFLIHGGYLQDWLADPAATNWRTEPAVGGQSRAFADIGVHWCDLVEFVTGDRIAALTAVTASVHDRSAVQPTEDLAALIFRTSGGATGSMQVSQVSWGRKNRLELYIDTERAAYGFEQERPDRLWVGGAAGATILDRGSGFEAAEARRFERVPAGHPQGYQDCFDAFVADVYAALNGSAPDGLPTFADGYRAAVLTEAVLSSAADGGWVRVD